MSNPLRRTTFTAFLIGVLLVVQAVHAAPVPEFTLPLLDGTTTSLQQHRGAPILINFFHSH